ncbi:TrmH family RNA methyltransferase [bacterium]|nr:TrmH family RNA methyltransferase [bacterium]
MPRPDYDAYLCAYLASFMTEHRRSLLPKVLLDRTRHLTVVLEDLHKPHNASACLRTCDCFGLQDVHVVENQNEFFAHRDIARGAPQWLTLYRHRDLAENTRPCLQSLKDAGFQIVMTSPHETDCQLETCDIRQPTALIFGNEKFGASPIAREMADHVMQIPMYGFAESFNISVALGVALHHLTWKLRQLDIDWQLTSEERIPLLRKWVQTANAKHLASLKQRFDELWHTGEIDTSVPPGWPETPV